MNTFPKIACLLAAACLSTSCGRQPSSGDPAPTETAPTPLTAVLDSPAEFDGKIVVLDGRVSSQCPSRCDLVFAEGASTVSIHTDAETTPRIPTGRRVRVTAAVHNGERQVVLNAVGLELVPEGGTP